MAEPQLYNGMFSMRVRASMNANEKRIERNLKDADKYDADGYEVYRNMHPNGAFFAIIGKHHEHEIEVARILAENGISVSLDREGQKIKMHNGRNYILPAPDGSVVGNIRPKYTHEIRAIRGADKAKLVVAAINHSYKTFDPDPKKNIQTEIAISVAERGSNVTRNDIANGVREYKRQVKTGESQGKPRIYLHVDIPTRSVYYWSLK